MSKLLEERNNKIEIYSKLSANLLTFEERAGATFDKINKYKIEEGGSESFKLLLERMKKYAYLAEQTENQIDKFCAKQDAELLFYLGSENSNLVESKVGDKDAYYYIYDKGITFTEENSIFRERLVANNEIDVSDILTAQEPEDEVTTQFEYEQKVFYINMILEAMMNSKEYQSWEELRVDAQKVMTLIRRGESIDSFVSFSPNVR